MDKEQAEILKALIDFFKDQAIYLTEIHHQVLSEINELKRLIKEMKE